MLRIRRKHIMAWNVTEINFENISASNSTDCDDDRGEYEKWSIILLGVFTLIGTVGNIGLLVVVLSTKHLRTAANIMVVNLTVGDLLYLLITVPFHIEHDINPSWQFGAIVCKFSRSGQVAAQGVCVLSLFALSLERHQAITKPRLRASKHKMHKTLSTVAIIWLISIVISVPIMILANIDSHTGCFPICIYLPLFSPMAKAYTIFRFLALYVLPLAAISCFYINIARVLLQSQDNFKHETQPGARQFMARRRLAIIVLVITLLFGILWLPYYAYNIWFQFRSVQYMMNEVHRIWNLLYFFQQLHFFMGVGNSCLNPWVVFIMSSTHRNELLNCIRCRRQTTKTHARNSYAVIGSKVKHNEVHENMELSQTLL